MSSYWATQFRRRTEVFSAPKQSDGNHVPLSIKIRVESGCFHREHSPAAYEIIDSHLATLPCDEMWCMEEHESGPELLVWFALGTGAINLADSVVKFVTAIIQARSDGHRRGDGPDAALELVVRRFDENGTLREEKMLRVASDDVVSEAVVQVALEEGVKRILALPAGSEHEESEKNLGNPD